MVLSFLPISTATDPQIEHELEQDNTTPSETPTRPHSSSCPSTLLTPDGKATEDLSHGLQSNEAESDQERAVLPGGSPQTSSANCRLSPDDEGV